MALHHTPRPSSHPTATMQHGRWHMLSTRHCKVCKYTHILRDADHVIMKFLSHSYPELPEGTIIDYQNRQFHQKMFFHINQSNFTGITVRRKNIFVFNAGNDCCVYRVQFSLAVRGSGRQILDKFIRCVEIHQVL